MDIWSRLREGPGRAVARREISRRDHALLTSAKTATRRVVALFLVRAAGIAPVRIVAKPRRNAFANWEYCQNE